MISFNGCIYNTVVKLLIYINPHLRIVEDIINIIPERIHVFIQYRSAQKQKLVLVVFGVDLIYIIYQCSAAQKNL
jgi:hypothetical protein